QLVVDGCGVFAPEAEGNPADDLIHDFGQIFLDGGGLEVGPHRLIAAGDVVADPRGRHRVAVRDHAADGLGVAQVVVGHEGSVGHVAHPHHPHHLVDGGLIGNAPYFNAPYDLKTHGLSHL